MSNCPRCHQPVDPQAIECPYCRTPLKAYGHPGMTLHRSDAGNYLCKTCVYDADDTCTYPQRPYATECLLYTDINQPSTITPPPLSQRTQLRLWLRRNGVWVLLAVLVGVSLLMALN